MNKAVATRYQFVTIVKNKRPAAIRIALADVVCARCRCGAPRARICPRAPPQLPRPDDERIIVRLEAPTRAEVLAARARAPGAVANRSVCGRWTRATSSRQRAPKRAGVMRAAVRRVVAPASRLLLLLLVCVWGGGAVTIVGTDSGDFGGKEDYVAQNALTNNLVWTRSVPAGAEVRVPFTYTIEAPRGQPVEQYDS